MKQILSQNSALAPETYVGARGTLTVDENKVVLSIHNGVTPGGTALNLGGTVKSVAISGGTTGLFTRGGPIVVSGTILLDGVLRVTNGGTGATTPASAFKALAPSIVNQAGKVLGTDGTDIFWTTVPTTAQFIPSQQRIISTKNQVIFNTTVNTSVSAPGKLHQAVFLNGILQIEKEEYNVTGAKQITMISPVSAGNDIVIHSYL